MVGAAVVVVVVVGAAVVVVVAVGIMVGIMVGIAVGIMVGVGIGAAVGIMVVVGIGAAVVVVVVVGIAAGAFTSVIERILELIAGNIMTPNEIDSMEVKELSYGSSRQGGRLHTAMTYFLTSDVETLFLYVPSKNRAHTLATQIDQSYPVSTEVKEYANVLASMTYAVVLTKLKKGKGGDEVIWK